MNNLRNSTLCTMVMEEKTLIVENISAIDGPLTFEDVITNNLDMENMHLKPNSLLKIEIS
jgi:hypothetical protein